MEKACSMTRILYYLDSTRKMYSKLNHCFSRTCQQLRRFALRFLANLSCCILPVWSQADRRE